MDKPALAALRERVEKLTQTQHRGLLELDAASAESIGFGGSGWVRTAMISGLPSERSAGNMRALVAKGLAEGKKNPGAFKQSQWLFRTTESGRALLRSLEAGER